MVLVHEPVCIYMCDVLCPFERNCDLKLLLADVQDTCAGLPDWPFYGQFRNIWPFFNCAGHKKRIWPFCEIWPFFWPFFRLVTVKLGFH